MKKIMTLICVLVMSAVATSVSAKDIDTTPFDKVQVGVAARVRVIDGDKYSVNIRTTEQSLAEDVKVNVENGVLAISSRQGDGLIPEGEAMIITITCPTDLDVVAGVNFDAYDVESEPTAEPQAPDFRPFPMHRMPMMPHFPMGHPWMHA